MAIWLIIISLLLSLTVPDLTYAQDTSETKVIAEVNGEKITVKDFEEAIQVTEERLRSRLTEEEKMEVLNIMIDKVLLDQEARDRKLHELPEVVTTIERAKRNILVKTLRKAEVSDKISYTEEDLKAYYEKNIEKYEPTIVTADVVRISRFNGDHVPVGEEAEKHAHEIKERLSKGEEPQDIVLEYKDETDFIVENKSFINQAKVKLILYDNELVNQTFAMEPGTTSLFHAEESIFIVKVKDKQRLSSFESEKNKAAVDLQYGLRTSLYQNLVSNLREKAQVTVNDEMVP
jgi:peptidyl-prolyl cis-trans isomerase C